jgi:hypothetical protein
MWSSSAFLQVDRKFCDFGIYPVVPDFPHETLCYRSLSHFLRSVEQHPDAERIALVPMLDSIPAFPVRAEQTSRPL